MNSICPIDSPPRAISPKDARITFPMTKLKVVAGEFAALQHPLNDWAKSFIKQTSKRQLP